MTKKEYAGKLLAPPYLRRDPEAGDPRKFAFLKIFMVLV
jgi:hypothetical protein